MTHFRDIQLTGIRPSRKISFVFVKKKKPEEKNRVHSYLVVFVVVVLLE